MTPGLVEEQRRLGRGNCVAFGTPEPEVEQADFLLLKLNDLVFGSDDLRQTPDPVLQVLNELADVGGERVE